MFIIDFSADENDLLKETVNVAMGKAGARLAELLGSFVELSIPDIQIVAAEGLADQMSRGGLLGGQTQLTAVRQTFCGGGQLEGEAIVVFDESSPVAVARVVGIDAVDRRPQQLELLLEMSNLLIGACLNGISRQLLARDLTFDPPAVLAENRGHIERLLDAEFHRASRHGGALCLLMFDLDHFKRVNDTYGHLAGDEVLRRVAHAIREQIRTEDMLGRYGGEEFLAVLPHTDGASAAKLAERLRACVEKLDIVHGDQTIAVTMSLGVAQHRAEMKDYLELIHAADIALYQAKLGGRNRFTEFVAQPAALLRTATPAGSNAPPPAD